mgnify:CR=1 FL=1
MNFKYFKSIKNLLESNFHLKQFCFNILTTNIKDLYLLTLNNNSHITIGLHYLHSSVLCLVHYDTFPSLIYIVVKAEERGYSMYKHAIIRGHLRKLQVVVSEMSNKQTYNKWSTKQKTHTRLRNSSILKFRHQHLLGFTCVRWTLHPSSVSILPML